MRLLRLTACCMWAAVLLPVSRPSPASAGDPHAGYADLPGASLEEATPQQRRALQYVELAEKKLAENDHMGAIMAADAAIAEQAHNPRAYNKKATALNLMGRFLEAEQASLRSLDQRKEGNTAAYDNLAWSQLQQSRYQEAAISAGHAIRMKPDEAAKAYAFRAFAREQMGDHKGKLEDIEMAADLFPTRFAEMAAAAKRGKRMFTPTKGAGRAGGLSKFLRSFSTAGSLALLGTGMIVLGFLTWILVGTWKRALDEPKRAAEREREPAQRVTDLLADKYRLARVIGHGGMGQVWEGTDVTLGRIVALKKMSEDLGEHGSKVREYYLKEARTVASLHHPHIIGIYEILDLEEGLYLVFEMAKGKTVQQLLAENKSLSLSNCRTVLQPVCEALDYAHSRGVVHRDLKPANIMLTDQGFVKVMDFGIARKISERVDVSEGKRVKAKRDSRGILRNHTRTIVGTPVYMAPEAERGVVTSVSDVYSLGVCCYEMLTGRLPYDPRSGMTAKLDRDYIKPTSHDPDLPPGLDDLVYDTLDPNPERRIPSSREFLARLSRLSS